MKFIELTMFTGEHVEEEDDLVEEATQPVTIDASDVREFYKRKYGRPGTRVVFRNGAARLVREDYAAVKAAIAGLTN